MTDDAMERPRKLPPRATGWVPLIGWRTMHFARGEFRFGWVLRNRERHGIEATAKPKVCNPHPPSNRFGEPMTLPIVASPELHAARTELAILHDIFAIIRSGRMSPEEWPKAKSILDYLDAKVSAAQATADALTPNVPAETDAGPVIPSKAAEVAAPVAG